MVVVVVVSLFFFPSLFYFGTREKRLAGGGEKCVCLGEEVKWAVKGQKRAHGRERERERVGERG